MKTGRQDEGQRRVVKASVEFFRKANLLHGHNCDYSESVYTSAKAPFTFRCKQCNEYHTQYKVNHLRSKFTCPETRRLDKTLSDKGFKALVNLQGEGNYIPLSTYKNKDTKIRMLHTVCGYEYTPTPGSFIQGRRCPYCAAYGFQYNEAAILYYFELRGVYKIGVTKNTVKHRYPPCDYKDMTSIKTWEFDKGADAYYIEQQVIKQCNEYLYKGKSVFKDKTGITECFTKDILKEIEKELNNDSRTT